MVVQPLPQGRISELSQQNGLYTLVLEGIQNDELKKEKQVIDVLEDFVNPYTDYSSFLNYAKNPELKMIVSNTTEAGIILNENDIDDTVVSDSYPGKLLSFLKFRYDFFDGDPDKGFFIVPCELIDFNGSKLKDILNQLSHLRHYSDSFIHWLNTANLYYNTLVDRIVPGYPADNITKLEKENGYKDHNIVKGETLPSSRYVLSAGRHRAEHGRGLLDKRHLDSRRRHAHGGRRQSQAPVQRSPDGRIRTKGPAPRRYRSWGTIRSSPRRSTRTMPDVVCGTKASRTVSTKKREADESR